MRAVAWFAVVEVILYGDLFFYDESVFSTKTTFLVETATWHSTTNIKIRSNYQRMVHQDASYVFSTTIPACSATKLNLLTRVKLGSKAVQDQDQDQDQDLDPDALGWILILIFL